METDRTKIKKVEVACFFFKEQMNMHLKTAETMRELESSPLENLLASVFKRKPNEFKIASKKLPRALLPVFLRYAVQ